MIKKMVRHLFGTEEKTSAAGKRNLYVTDSDDAGVIRSSLLFNEAWYRSTYGLGEYLDAAAHYLQQGWKMGYEPSQVFSGRDYLERYEDVRTAGINPLLHLEKFGYAEGRWHAEIQGQWTEILSENPECQTSLQDGFLRLRITNACNAKCRYCGVRLGFGPEKEHAMDPVWFYEYCRPLYERVKMILVTGGDAFVAQESYAYMKFLSEEYPQVTVMTESNGIAFDEKFQHMAADNLFKTHFSINASTAEVFSKGCWEGTGGEIAYPKLMENIKSYMASLEQTGKLCFAPSLSMVINKDNFEDVLDFMKLSLRMHAWYIGFFFDYTENNMAEDYFGCPETSRPVLRMLMELERLLAGKVLVYFRLWLPIKETEGLQREVEALPLAELQEKYAEVWSLAKDRSVVAEFEERNTMRRLAGKKELTFDEDMTPSIQLKERCGRAMCFAPWQELDLYPNGRMDFCGWFVPTQDIHSFIQDGSVDWARALNSFAYMSARKRMLQGNFRGCQACCPMNSSRNPIVPVHKYGLERLQK